MKKIIAGLFVVIGAIFLYQLLFSNSDQTSTEAAVTDDQLVYMPVVTKPDPTPTPEPTATPSNTPTPGENSIYSVVVPDTVNKFDKLEIDFQIGGLIDQNKQLPYLAAADANEFTQDFVGDGVSADAIFIAPNGTEYRQPAFWYEHHEGLLAINQSGWKIRFAPHEPGAWAVKIAVEHRDASLMSETYSFTVADTAAKGFLQVAESDNRYFEFDNGDYYSNIGFNFSVKELDDEQEIELLTSNGINYLRAWVSRMNITGGAWSHLSMKPVVYDGYLPRDAVTRYRPEGKSEEEFWWRLGHNHNWYSSCLYTNQEYDAIRVKQNTNYLIQTEYATYGVTPADGSRDYGYTVAIQDWVDNCGQVQSSSAVTEHSGNRNEQNLVSDGIWNSGDNYTIPYVYPMLDNVSAGDAYIKSISIREMLADGSLGPELFIDYKADKRDYYSQRESALLDNMIEVAEDNGLYLRLVLSEKEDPLLVKGDRYGNPTDLDRQNFYGEGRTVHYNRYLLMSWWRYVQARWGYSTAIHSWELINEGDPFNAGHYNLADEMGKYMNCTVFGVEAAGNDCTYDHPNGHMVSTSFWHSFPADEFLRNTGYPNIDFGDQHKYLPKDEWQIHEDITTAVLELGQTIGDGSASDTNKPTLRGETGIVDAGTDGPISELRNGNNPVWLHNMLWSSLNASGVMEAGYWYPEAHIYNNSFNLLNHFDSFANFVDTIPLSNGNYAELNGSFSDGSYRLMGQKDGVTHHAHGWLRHPDFTWKKVDGGQSNFGINGTLTLTGFEPNDTYTVSLQTYSLSSGYVQTSQQVSADGSGTLSISLNTAGDVGSVAFKVSR